MTVPHSPLIAVWGQRWRDLSLVSVTDVGLYDRCSGQPACAWTAVFTLIAGIFSLGAIGCYLLCYFMTTERVKIAPTHHEEQVSFKETVKALVSNRALLGIIAAAILLLLASLMTQSVNQYVFVDYFKNKEALAVMSVAGILPMLLMAPFTVPITRKYGKKEVGAVGCILGGIASLLMFVLQVKSAAVYIAISVIGYFGFGFFNLIIWAFITDIIDDQEVRTGKREDGTIYAVYSFARKIGQALSGGLGAYALALVGYDSTVQVQTAEVAGGIYNVATLVPGILYIGVGLCLIFIYPLNKKRVEGNIAVLKERREVSYE